MFSIWSLVILERAPPFAEKDTFIEGLKVFSILAEFPINHPVIEFITFVLMLFW